MKSFFTEYYLNQYESIQIMLVFLVSFLITYIFIPVLIKFANRKKLFDRPNERKIHTKQISSLGGVAMIIGILSSFAIWLRLDINAYEPYILISILLLFSLGFVDDLIELSPGIRFAGQIVAAGLICFSGLRIESLHGVFGIYDLSVIWQYIFTIFLIIGVINALNMIDGIDGLAGGLSFISFVFFGFLFYIQNDVTFTLICVSFAAVLLAFLRYNFPPAKIFMGDSGSVVLGFILTVSGIKLLSVDTFQNPVFNYSQILIIVFATLILPVYDTLRVFSVRVLNKKSPFFPDKNHIHHLIIKLGFCHKRTTLILFLIQISLILSSFLLMNFHAGFSVLFLLIETIIMYELLVVRKLVKSIHQEKKNSNQILKYEVQNRLLTNHFKNITIKN